MQSYTIKTKQSGCLLLLLLLLFVWFKSISPSFLLSLLFWFWRKSTLDKTRHSLSIKDKYDSHFVTPLPRPRRPRPPPSLSLSSLSLSLSLSLFQFTDTNFLQLYSLRSYAWWSVFRNTARPFVLFSFCSVTASDPENELLQFSEVDVSPYPIVVPGNVSVSSKLKINREFSGNITLRLTIQIKIGSLWLRLPCVANIGSW